MMIRSYLIRILIEDDFSLWRIAGGFLLLHLCLQYLGKGVFAPPTQTDKDKNIQRQRQAKTTPTPMLVSSWALSLSVLVGSRVLIIPRSNVPRVTSLNDGLCLSKQYLLVLTPVSRVKTHLHFVTLEGWVQGGWGLN